MEAEKKEEEGTEKKKPMTLVELRPAKAKFIIGGNEYTLNEYSLFYKSEMIEKFGLERILRMAISTQTEQELLLSYAAWLLLDEPGKKAFPSVDDLRKAIVQPEEYKALMSAINKAVGVAESSALTAAEQLQLEEEKKNFLAENPDELNPDWHYLYWRSVFSDMNEMGISDAAIWGMTEREINAKLWERRLRNLSKTLDGYLSYGDAGVEELYKLLPSNPLVVLYEKREKARLKREKAFDTEMIKKTLSMLDKYDMKNVPQIRKGH